MMIKAASGKKELINTLEKNDTGLIEAVTHIISSFEGLSGSDVSLLVKATSGYIGLWTKADSGKWLLLVHQIPPKPNTFRVKIWRRLQKTGAVPSAPAPERRLYDI